MAEGGDIEADCEEHNDRGQGFHHIARKRPNVLCFFLRQKQKMYNRYMLM